MVIVITIVLAVFFTLYAVNSARSKKLRQRWISVVTATRWWMLPVAFADTVLKVLVITLLWNIEWMRIGWWSLIGGAGNVLTGQSSDAEIAGQSTNGAQILLTLGVAIPVILLFLLPLLALSEEETFRKGIEEKTVPVQLLSALGFGMVHLLVGVPLAVALALIVSGVIYTMVYVQCVQKNHVSSFSTVEESQKALVTHQQRFIDFDRDKSMEEHKSAKRITETIYANQSNAVISAASVHALSNIFFIGSTLTIAIGAILNH